MPTESRTPSAPRGYGEPAGIRLVAAIEGAGVDLFTAAQAVDQGAGLGLTPGHTRTLLHQLAAGGWITRIKRGFYAVNNPVTRFPRAHPFAMGTSIVSPSAVSHWSALQHWGLTEQIPASVRLSSPVRTFPPAEEAEGRGGRPAWVVADVRYEFVTITRPRFFGIAKVWVNERNQVPILDRERALLDTFHHFYIFGSLSVALETLETHLAEIDVERLVQYAVRLRIGSVVKRLGWALEQFGIPAELLVPLRAYPAKGHSPLDPGLPARGRHNLTWHVIENLHDG